MILIMRLPDRILQDLKEALGLDAHDSLDPEVCAAFNKLDANTAFKLFLEYNGIVGYDSLIREALDTLRDSEINLLEVTYEKEG